MDSTKKMPRFSYNFSSPSKNDFGCIVADDVVFHRVCDFDEFYRALGYTDDMRMTGSILPDEFIWDRYSRNNNAKSVRCLQSKIMAYLINHSERFREEFGGEYANMIGQCLSDRKDDRDLCFDCPKHHCSISLESQGYHPI